MSDLYDIIMRCLQAGPYAGQEFQDKAFQWLEDSQSVSQEELESGWAKLHAEYERLTAPHWRSVLEKLSGTRWDSLKQGELFNV